MRKYKIADIIKYMPWKGNTTRLFIMVDKSKLQVETIKGKVSKLDGEYVTIYDDKSYDLS